MFAQPVIRSILASKKLWTLLAVLKNSKIVTVSHQNKMSWGQGIALLTLFFATSLVASVSCPPPQYDETELAISHVYDGDTIRLTDGRKIRFLGINTTEMNHHRGGIAEPYAREATRYLKNLLEHHKVNLVFEDEKQDHYKRYLAHVYLDDGTLLQQKMLEAGLATAIIIPPNLDYIPCYLGFEESARQNQIKLWSLPKYQIQKANEIRGSAEGYMMVQGKARDVYHYGGNVWVKFTPHFSLKISKRYQPYFDEAFLQRLENETLRVRGFTRSFYNRARLALKHPLQIEFLDD